MMTRAAICFVVLGVAVVVTGCGSKADKAGDGHTDKEPGATAHAHVEEGAHGGLLIELGDAYHAELVADHDTHTVTVYFEDCESPAKEVAATAVTLSVFKDGEFVDFAFNAGTEPATFSLADESLCELLDHDKDIKSRLKATIAGEELVAAYEHESH